MSEKEREVQVLVRVDALLWRYRAWREVMLVCMCSHKFVTRHASQVSAFTGWKKLPKERWSCSWCKLFYYRWCIFTYDIYFLLFSFNYVLTYIAFFVFLQGIGLVGFFFLSFFLLLLLFFHSFLFLSCTSSSFCFISVFYLLAIFWCVMCKHCFFSVC